MLRATDLSSLSRLLGEPAVRRAGRRHRGPKRGQATPGTVLPGLDRAAPHLAGRLGALLLQHFLDKGAFSRKPGTRVVQLGPAASAYLADAFGVDWPAQLPA
jgi:hypothetical protein